MHLFLLMKHLIFLSNIAILPFATITLQGLYPKTRAILSINKSFFMLRNPETNIYIAFNDVQITHQLTTSSVNCIEYI